MRYKQKKVLDPPPLDDLEIQLAEEYDINIDDLAKVKFVIQSGAQDIIQKARQEELTIDEAYRQTIQRYPKLLEQKWDKILLKCPNCNEESTFNEMLRFQKQYE